VAGDPSSPQGTPRRALLGELLVQSKVITPEQLAESLSAPRQPGQKIGQVLIERGWLTEAQLTQTLSLQLSVPWVSLYHIDFSRQLLNRVARELAERHCLIPIFVRHVKGHGETLYVAMEDPSNQAALAEVSQSAALPAKPMIASASDIRSAIRVYYGEGDAPPPTRAEPATTRQGKTGVEPPPPTPPVPPTTPDAHRPSRPPAGGAGSQPPPPLPPRAASQPPRTRSTPPAAEGDEPPPTTRSSPPPGGVAAAAAAEDPQQARRRSAKMLSLTLLDGTTIQLPAQQKGQGADAGLTARDFVSALRATAHGADAAEVLGEHARWEPVVAALLSILLRKGLIADWEFVEELRKG
jgi:type IV pilus assembly protein PilB